jgi:hypothetical protein
VTYFAPPAHAAAILLLPSGHRAFDEDFCIPVPVPETLDIQGDDGAGVYHLLHRPIVGSVDAIVRALYVLGGTYRPGGYHRTDQHDPDEVHDQ